MRPHPTVLPYPLLLRVLCAMPELAVEPEVVDQWLYRRPYLYPKQEAAIFDPARISCIEASTKSGKTVACMAWIFEKAWLGQPNTNYWWVAPYYGQANIAYTRMKDGCPPQIKYYNDNKLYLKLYNGNPFKRNR